MKLKASQYGLLILVAMVITRAFLLDEDEVNVDDLFERNDGFANAYSESSDRRSQTYSVQNLIATANSIVFDGGINYENFASMDEERVFDFTPAVAVTEQNSSNSPSEELLAMNDIASSDGESNGMPIELQLFAPSQKLNRIHEGNEEYAAVTPGQEEAVESIPLDGESTITEQMARLFPRR